VPKKKQRLLFRESEFPETSADNKQRTVNLLSHQSPSPYPSPTSAKATADEPAAAGEGMGCTFIPRSWITPE
jgi:hypothetical protein